MGNLKDKNLLIITNSYPDKDDKQYRGIFVKEQVKYLKDYFKEVYVISPQPWRVNRNLGDYEYDNVRVFFPRFFHVPTKYFRKKLGDNFLKAALRVIKREKLEFDLIHAHFIWPSGYAGTLLKKRLNVPLVVTAHGFDVYSLPFREKYYRERILEALEGADHIITVSHSNLRVLINDLGFSPGKISLIPNGFNEELFKPMPKQDARTRLGLPQDRKIILTVGNLVPIKGHEYLIKAAKRVVIERDDVLFVIVGDGPLKAKLKKLVDSLELKGYFHFVGSRPHGEIPLWMNAGDVFVLPSIRESFGIAQIEAMACGKPVVSTYNGGSEEVIVSEDYGFLCPPRDPECLSEKILIALERRWNNKKIRAYAQRYTWRYVVNQVLNVYSDILGDRK